MIINIRGTSGSGKTTAIRRLMEVLGGKGLRMKIAGRNRPIAHVYERTAGLGSIALVGSYETVCGGCDTISHYDTCFGIIRQLEDKGVERVIYEGLRQSGDVKRALELHNEGRDLRVLSLTTPLEECLDAVRQRRLAAGNTKEFNPKNTTTKFHLLGRSNERLREAGVRVYEVDRDEAWELLKELCCAPTS